MRRSTERGGAMLGCFAGGGRRPPSPALAAVYEEASTSTGSTSVGTGSPPSSASTSSQAFLDEMAPLYSDDSEREADAGGLSTAIASRRFFLATPGRSNSIVDSSAHAAVVPRGGRSVASSDAATRSWGRAATAKNCDDDAVRRVSVSTVDPRAEFFKSMVEMAEALELDPRRGADRARLHDLLLCYITLNDHGSLRDILAAFTDLLFLLNTPTSDGRGGAKR